MDIIHLTYKREGVSQFKKAGMKKTRSKGNSNIGEKEKVWRKEKKKRQFFWNGERFGMYVLRWG